MNHNIVFGENLQNDANWEETLLNLNSMISFANQTFSYSEKKKTGFCKELGSVVLRLDNAILRINHYLADEC